MFVTIWRHGEAGSAVTDRMRELTDQGRDDIGFACQQFHAHCEARGIPHPDLVLYSEWVRTAQTKDIVAGAFSHVRTQRSAALIPGCRPGDVDSELEVLYSSEDQPAHLILVSHQPLVSALVDYYLGESGRVPPLSPGGLVTLSLEIPAAGCATLVFSAQAPLYEPMQ